MRRKYLIGAILAWDDWRAVAGQSIEESETSGRSDQTLTIVAARNHLLKLADQFADEEQRGIFAPVTVTRQGAPVMAIVSWGWFQRVTHVLRRQAVPSFHIEPDGSLTLSSNETETPARGEHEVIPDYIHELSLLWSHFQQTASTIALHIPTLTNADLSATPSFDHACAVLEGQCARVQRLAQEFLAILQLLPIHTAIMQHYSSLPDGIDQQTLREVEALARTTYEQAITTGASKHTAWKTARQACLAWALQRSWSQGQFRLSHDVEQLIENVLIQVRELVVRRHMGMFDVRDEKQL
jgi:hypothetical protein